MFKVTSQQFNILKSINVHVSMFIMVNNTILIDDVLKCQKSELN